MILASMQLGTEKDIVLTRQRGRQIARLLSFDAQEQVRIATAISEAVRETLTYCQSAEVQFRLDTVQNRFVIQLICSWRDSADDDAAGNFYSSAGMTAARRLIGPCEFIPGDNGIRVELQRPLPPGLQNIDDDALRELAESVSNVPSEDFYQEFRNQNQELLAALNAMRDHQTELAKLNRELEETNRGVMALYAELEDNADSLRQAGEQKTRFYSGISHEFRTPINSILGLSRLLLNRVDGDLSVEQERQVKLIQACADNLLEWVNDLLDVARVDAGRMELRVESFYLGDLLAGLRGVMRPLAVNPAVVLEFEVPLELQTLELRTDEGKISQILRNLISNALKFTERGEVRVSVRTPGQSAEAIEFSVRDTGVGISPEHIQRIFDEFYQVDGPLQRRSKGTGLGLPLSRRLASLIGGSIRASSEPGRGSVFSLTIPRQFSSATTIQQAVGEASQLGLRSDLPALSRPRVLLIDDDAPSRYLLAQALAALPLDVTEAEGGRQGLELAALLRPQAVFLDLGMPDLNGFEVLRLLRQAPHTRNVPIVIYSAQELSERERELLCERATAILPKPARGGEFSLERVRETLAQAGVVVSWESNVRT